MAKTYEEEVNLEKIKHDNKKELLRLEEARDKRKHEWKMEELNLNLEIVKVNAAGIEGMTVYDGTNNTDSRPN